MFKIRGIGRRLLVLGGCMAALEVEKLLSEEEELEGVVGGDDD